MHLVAIWLQHQLSGCCRASMNDIHSGCASVATQCDCLSKGECQRSAYKLSDVRQTTNWTNCTFQFVNNADHRLAGLLLAGFGPSHWQCRTADHRPAVFLACKSVDVTGDSPVVKVTLVMYNMSRRTAHFNARPCPVTLHQWR